MRRTPIYLGIVALLVTVQLFCTGCTITPVNPPQPVPLPVPGPVPPVTPVTPADISVVLQPVRDICNKGNRTLARQVAGYFRDFGKALPGDAKTNAQVKRACERYGALVMTAPALQNAFPGFSKASDDARVKVLGTDDKPLDVQRAKLFFEALALACEGK